MNARTFAARPLSEAEQYARDASAEHEGPQWPDEDPGAVDDARTAPPMPRQPQKAAPAAR